MILADIGNSFVHIFDLKKVYHLKFEDFLKQYKEQKLFYINVNPNLKEILKNNSLWIDISPYIDISGSYSTMGVDRKALLLSRDDGIYIDAGSAITIDKKIDSKFVGGFILPGIWRVKKCYGEISSALNLDEIKEINLSKLPKSNTKETISYSIIAPIICLVNSINFDNLPIYCCGGDGKFISSFFKNAIYKEDLIFEGMLKVIKEKKLC